MTTNERRLMLSAEVLRAEKFLAAVAAEAARTRDRLKLAADRFYHTDEDDS